ncbi:single-stranded DNA-binding protein [Pediococcus acidilactici]|uniref:single-stranded DNA-binding protein n=1 Tax=Pediococcus acidilactici TaxID=1254 RepID=UPI00330574B2
MINRTVLIGRLTKDVELRHTAKGDAVASFTVAVNRQFTNSQGEREADFINCVMWRKAAENFAKYTHKGSLVGIEGRIQTRSYENQQGQRVYVTEIVADNFSLLDSKPKGNQQNNAQQASTPGDPFANGGQSIDIGDDDLPF